MLWAVQQVKEGGIMAGHDYLDPEQLLAQDKNQNW